MDLQYMILFAEIKKKTGGQNNTFKEARIPYLLNFNTMLI